MPGILSLISTPIGNLRDMTYRAVDTLRDADIIACEDTRVTRKLLSAYEIGNAHVVSIHQHSSDREVRDLVKKAEEGARVAYVSDAGTPGVNDPGGIIAECAYANGVRIEVIPGPSALTAAIAACGFPMEHFTYIGFIPQKKHRARTFKAISENADPTVFFESTHRIMKTLDELAQSLDAERMVYVGRELTKLFETHLRDPIASVISSLKSGSTKGEFTVIVGPKRKTIEHLREKA
jgi:16S rRNA (cytidine1402-2'-O)-methyltransferase